MSGAKPALDTRAAATRLTEVSLDVESETALRLLTLAARAASSLSGNPRCRACGRRPRPFALPMPARSIETALADFRTRPTTASAWKPPVTALRLVDIAFDAKTLRVIAEADGSANVTVSSLPGFVDIRIKNVHMTSFLAHVFRSATAAIPTSRLCMCTMNAIPNKRRRQVEDRDRHERRDEQPGDEDRALMLPSAVPLASAGGRNRIAARMKYSRHEQERGGEKEDHGAEAGEQQERKAPRGRPATASSARS